METQQQKKEKNEKKILSFLKRGEQSTTAIANLLNRNYYYTLQMLIKLWKEKKIEEMKVGKFTIWRFKK